MRAAADRGAGPRPSQRAWFVPALLAAGLAAAPVAVTAAQLEATPLFRRERLWTYVEGGPALTGYSRAMTQYRLWLDNPQRPVGVAGLMTGSDYGDTRWTWQSQDGSLIRRLDDGRFAVTRGNCVDGFCLEVFCFGAGWPTFDCDDGVSRKMSAPDFQTVVFDGVTFKREALPTVDEAPAEP